MSDQQLAVIGSGTMGAGLAALAVGNGLPVVLVDTDPAVLADADERVTQNLRTAGMFGALRRDRTAEGLLRTAGSLEAVAGATAVIECVTELPQLKAEVLGRVSALVRPGTVLLTNTSAIPVDELAEAVQRPEDLVGAHFMNPPYLISGVEVVRGPRTGDQALNDVRALLGELDRQPVVVGDGPGFVINRVLQRVINEAATIVQEGIATPEAVDALFTQCLGHRTGPLATGDLIGLDNVVDTLRVLHERTGADGYQPCDLLLAKVEQGRLGRKSGAGFYDYGAGNR